MRKLILALAIVVLAVSASASDKTDVMATVRQFTNGFNHGDVASALATCASPASVLDEFPPYAWQGEKACADWANDYDAASKRDGVTNGHVTMGKPLSLEVTGDRAYAVFPVSYSYKQKGKGVVEAGARLVMALQKTAGSWKITSWAWSKH